MTDTGPNPSPDLNATEARQGWRSNRIIWVLLGGLALVIIGFIVIGASHSDDLSGANGGQELAPAAAANAFNAPEPAAKQNDAVKAPGVPGDQSPSPAAPQPSETQTAPANQQ
ncbi:MAG TPA: hypothetical protein VF559_05815 [Caulobacteraceae bacterium]|jgi:hypothetical protein